MQHDEAVTEVTVDERLTAFRAANPVTANSVSPPLPLRPSRRHRSLRSHARNGCPPGTARPAAARQWRAIQLRNHRHYAHHCPWSPYRRGTPRLHRRAEGSPGPVAPAIPPWHHRFAARHSRPCRHLGRRLRLWSRHRSRCRFAPLRTRRAAPNSQKPARLHPDSLPSRHGCHERTGVYVEGRFGVRIETCWPACRAAPPPLANFALSKR